MMKMPHWTPHFLRVLLMAAALTLATASAAQWTDPTRPPDDKAPPGTAGTAGASTAQRPKGAAGLSILIVGPDRSVAVIDGQLVKGAHTRVDGVRHRIRTHSVEREQDGERQRLSLHPLVQKTQRETDAVEVPQSGGHALRGSR